MDGEKGRLLPPLTEKKKEEEKKRRLTEEMLRGYGPYVGQVYMQVSFGGMFLITRLAFTLGMSNYVYVTYRQIIACLAICPVAFFFERDQRPPLKLRSIIHIFLLALLGITSSMTFYYAGLAYTSTTLASTINNITPGVTLLMAYLVRMETIDVKSKRGQAKILGTLLCIAGTIAMTLDISSNANHLKAYNSSIFLGVLYLVIGTWAWSVFLVYQAWFIKDYPCQLSLSALVNLMGTLQCMGVGFWLEKPSAFELKWDMGLIVVIYSGVFCSGFGMFITMWCSKEKGPVFTSVFDPLSTVLVAIFEPILLHVHLHWGSIVGMLTVKGGLYCVLWGKALDHQTGIVSTQSRQSQSKENSKEVEPNIRGLKEPLLAERYEQGDV